LTGLKNITLIADGARPTAEGITCVPGDGDLPSLLLQRCQVQHMLPRPLHSP